MDKITTLAVEYIKEKYNPHTIIIYGSRARGDATTESDVDIACFVDSAVLCEEIIEFNNILIDAFVFSTESMNMDNIDKFIKFNKAFCALDTRSLGKKLLDNVNKRILEGPIPLNKTVRQNKINLALKSLQQASKNNIIGRHKRTRLQFDLLETYFILRNKWYLGPKQSFIWLKDNDKKAYRLFDSVYENPLNIEELKKLTNYVLKI